MFVLIGLVSRAVTNTPLSTRVDDALRLEWRTALLRHWQRLVDNAGKPIGREESEHLGVKFGRKDLRIAREHKEARRKVVRDDRVRILAIGVEWAELDDPICSGEKNYAVICLSQTRNTGNGKWEVEAGRHNARVK